jgi:hypothetical protein
MASNVLCLGARHDPEAVTEPFHVKPLRALDPRGVVPDVGIVLEKKRAVHELDLEYARPLEPRPLRGSERSLSTPALTARRPRPDARCGRTAAPPP